MRSAALALVLVLSLPAFAQSHTKRLILKDGSFQSILEYKVEGERVRYKSADRFEWEDIPNALIDWDATNKYNSNPITNDRSRAERDAAEEEAKEAARSETDSPTVAPKLRLPDANIGGVYMLDDWKGAPELVEIVQNGADINKNFGKNVLRVTVNPFGGAHQSFELPGQHARAQAHTAQPTFYLCIETGEKQVDVASHYRIVHVTADAKKNTRSIGTLIVKASGKTSQAEKFVPSFATHLNDGPWVKVAPSQPLAPGEYAVVEMLGENEMNLYVWDFGVNADAAENVNAVKPRP